MTDQDPEMFSDQVKGEELDIQMDIATKTGIKTWSVWCYTFYENEYSKEEF